MDLSSLFTVSGRYGRKSFWLCWLGLVGASVLFGWLPGASAVLIPVSGAKAALGFLASLSTFVVLYCQVCIIAKRLHDMGRSGWLQAIPFASAIIIGVAGAVASQLVGELQIAAWSVNLGFLIWLGFLAWIGLTPSQPFANRWGSPTGRAAAAEAFA